MPGSFTLGMGLDQGLHTNNVNATGVLTTNVSTLLFAARAAGICNFLTNLVVQNTNATVPGNLTILDNVTVIFTINLPASMASPLIIPFNTPLKGTAATQMNIQVVTTGANVLYNAQGYSGPF